MPDREFWAVDCETDPFKAGRIPRPFILGCWNGSEYHVFNNVKDLVEFLRVRDCIAYAHNGGKFDWHYLLEFVEPFTDCMVIAGRLAKFQIDGCEFRDSFNIMPMPLRAGGHKLEIEDWSIFEKENRDKPENREIIEERLRTDCVYLYNMLVTFFMEFGQHLTISTASMNCWSKIADVEKPETTKEFYKQIAPYYFGGRVEAFSPGHVKGPYRAYDINSAYPYAMTFLHPYGNDIFESRSLPTSRKLIERCFVSLEAISLGQFPFRSDAGSLIFPADGSPRVFHVTGWEYLAALDTGHLRSERILSVLQLPDAIEFRAYMDHFYRMKDKARAANDAARYEFSKRFLCSLYGKFGSNPDEYSEYQLIPPGFIEQAIIADNYMFCAELGPHALMARPLHEMKQRYYNVAVAASVTGFVRAMDWRAIRAVREAGGTVHYIDTDCIHADQPGDLILDDARLGAWKLEAEFSQGYYGGKKLYACETSDAWRSEHPKAKRWKTASKGVRLSHDDIKRIALGEEVTYRPDAPQYSLKRGIRFQNRTLRKTA